jgi:hypothetical protein
MELLEVLQKTALSVHSRGISAENINLLENCVEVRIKLGTEYVSKFTITPSRDNPPGKGIFTDLKQEWRRFMVRYFKPQKDPAGYSPVPFPPNFKERGYYAISFSKDMEKIKFTYKMSADIKLFIENCLALQRASKAKENNDAKLAQLKEKAAITLKERHELRKKGEENRKLVFEALVASLSNFPTSISSTLDGELVNLKLPNELKVQLQAEPTGVVISDIELNKEFDPKEILEFIQKLSYLSF